MRTGAQALHERSTRGEQRAGVGEARLGAPEPGRRQRGDAAGVAVDAGFEGDPAAEAVAGDVRTLEALLVQELLEGLAQDVFDRAAVRDERGGLAVTGQVDEDHLAVRGEQVEHGIPGLAAVGYSMDEDQWFSRNVPFAGEHARP